MKGSLFILACCFFVFFGPLRAQHVFYIDGRPSASLRLPCKDEGIVLRHGDGVDSCDIFGAREAIVNKVGDRYYLFYDGAGKDGWRACLGESPDLRKWTKKGPILPLGDSIRSDFKSASSPWVIYSKGTWHMFYLGTPNASPQPDRIPAFPYLTLKAQAQSIEGPWIKQYDVVPFTTQPESFYSATSSPGFIVGIKGEFLQFFSGSLQDKNGVKRTLGLARTKDLNGTWKIESEPLFPPSEQVENSSLFFEEATRTWYLFTNHIGIDKRNGEYTDAIWVYWSKDIHQWNKENKAVVLDKTNCSWATGAIGMPTVIQVGERLALLYDAVEGNAMSHMHRDIGLAWLDLPLQIK